MARLIPSALVAVACILLAPACDAEACACTPMPEIAGIVTGTVFMPDSRPIALARVELLGGIAACDGEAAWHHDETDGEGAYEVYFDFHDVGDDDVCVVVQAFPPTGLAFGPSAPDTLVFGPEARHLDIVELRDLYLTAVSATDADADGS